MTHNKYMLPKCRIYFSPENTVRPILALIPHQNNKAIIEQVSKWHTIKVTLRHYSFKNGKIFIKKNQDPLNDGNVQHQNLNENGLILSKLAPQDSETKGSTLMLQFVFVKKKN